MSNKDFSPLKAGFLVRAGYNRQFVPSEELEAPTRITQAVTLIQQLGFLVDGEAHLQINQIRKRNTIKDSYSICLGSLPLLTLVVYANQIVNVEYGKKAVSVEEIVKALFLEAKKAFPDNSTLTKKSLGRFCLLQLTNMSRIYSSVELATLALSEVKTETLIGMMTNDMPVQAIMDMEEIPDSWLQTMIEKFADE
jgi:hypothetical protein